MSSTFTAPFPSQTHCPARRMVSGIWRSSPRPMQAPLATDNVAAFSGCTCWFGLMLVENMFGAFNCKLQSTLDWTTQGPHKDRKVNLHRISHETLVAVAQSRRGTPSACRHRQQIRQPPHPQRCVFMPSSLPNSAAFVPYLWASIREWLLPVH
jgi:hypothetical protein